MSARECKEDWFPSRTGSEKRGGIEFRPEFTSEVVFVIFLTYVAVVRRDALADYILLGIDFCQHLYDISVRYYVPLCIRSEKDVDVTNIIIKHEPHYFYHSSYNYYICLQTIRLYY